MRALNIIQVGTNQTQTWPRGNRESFPNWIDYRAVAADGQHTVRLSFGIRPAHGRDRLRAIVWVDGHPHAQFFEADDFADSGELLSEIKDRGELGEVLCRYPEDPIPDGHAAFRVVGLLTWVAGKGVHNAWAVVANVADHQTMIDLAGLQMTARDTQKLDDADRDEWVHASWSSLPPSSSVRSACTSMGKTTAGL